MPDQNTQTVRIDDRLNADQIIALPVGSTVSDKDGDMCTQTAPGKWFRDDAYAIKDPDTYFAKEHTPYKLVDLPNGDMVFRIPPQQPMSRTQPDLYQQARIALRDVLGMEPDEQMIRNTMAAHRPQITTMHETAKRVTDVPKPATPNLSAGFGIAVSGGGFAASATVHTDDTVNGLARLRAHSALDQLLDQHGISR